MFNSTKGMTGVMQQKPKFAAVLDFCGLFVFI